jgi:hypothetical protein
LAVLTHLQSPDSLREPHGLFGQSVRESLCQGFALNLVEMVWGFETSTLCGQVRDGLPCRGAPLTPATTGLPLCQEAPAALAYEGLWGWLALQKPPRGGLRQVLNQRMQRRKREVKGGAQLVASWADPLLECQVPAQHAVSGREGRLTGNGQQELTLAQSVADTGSLLCIGFTGPVRHRCTIVAHGLAVSQADLIATVLEPCVERLPIETGGCHGDEDRLTPVFDSVCLEGLLKAPEALTGVGKGERTTAQGGLRPHTSLVFGFAHLDANEEEGRVGYVRFPLIGVSSILWQSHGTSLLLG